MCGGTIEEQVGNGEFAEAFRPEIDGTIPNDETGQFIVHADLHDGIVVIPDGNAYTRNDRESFGYPDPNVGENYLPAIISEPFSSSSFFSETLRCHTST